MKWHGLIGWSGSGCKSASCSFETMQLLSQIWHLLPTGTRGLFCGCHWLTMCRLYTKDSMRICINALQNDFYNVHHTTSVSQTLHSLTVCRIHLYTPAANQITGPAASARDPVRQANFQENTDKIGFHLHTSMTNFKDFNWSEICFLYLAVPK